MLLLVISKSYIIIVCSRYNPIPRSVQLYNRTDIGYNTTLIQTLYRDNCIVPSFYFAYSSRLTRLATNQISYTISTSKILVCVRKARSVELLNSLTRSLILEAGKQDRIDENYKNTTINHDTEYLPRIVLYVSSTSLSIITTIRVATNYRLHTNTTHYS